MLLYLDGSLWIPDVQASVGKILYQAFPCPKEPWEPSRDLGAAKSQLIPFFKNIFPYIYHDIWLSNLGWV